MGVLYAPLLFVAAIFETRAAAVVRRNRAHGEEDDDVVEEWEALASQLDFEAEGWVKTCDAVKPNLEDDPAVLEVKKLRNEVEELKALLGEISKAVGATSGKAENGKEENKGKSASSSGSD